MTPPAYLKGLSNPQTISRRKGSLLNESNAQSVPIALVNELGSNDSSGD